MDPALVQWLTAWQAAINACDYARGAELFAEDVIAFGTYSDAMQGRSNLVEHQWREMWPYIRDFRFRLDEASVLDDGHSICVVICPWASLGVGPDGSTFPRAGRCTIVLERAESGLRARHTHFSMAKGSIARIKAA
jgi:ketosteroid isomerase-like protein